MDGAFIAKFVLQSRVNDETYTNKKIPKGQSTYKADQNTSTPLCEDKVKSEPAMAKYKKGSHEWLKHTFMGDKTEDYGDYDC